MKLNTIKKFIKNFPVLNHSIKSQNQVGFTLLEVLIVIALLSILVSISFVGYRTVTKATELKNLKQLSELFPNALGNCIASSGWEVTRLDGTTIKPCTTIQKIDYVCPEKATCTFHNNDTDKYVCLNIKKKIRGNQYEIHVIVNRNNRNDYKTLCSDKDTSVTSLEGISDSICKGSGTTSTYSGCDW